MNSIENMIAQAERELRDRFGEIEANEEARTRQVLDSFRKFGVSYRHFAPTTGYGYDDIGRDTLEKIYADLFNTEAALMRPHVASGTAALSLTLFGMTKPGERILSATGMPYDTLQSVIGTGEKTPPGSLKEMGIGFDCVELRDGKIDVAAVEKAITEDTGLIIAQRSRGYAWRPSLRPGDFRELAEMIHTRHPGIRLMVDNCYGEFVCGDEPTDYGADLCVGSLIKNPGGGIAPTGGYVVGRAEDIERIAYRLTAPGLGRELGSYAASYRPFYQGLFMAPHTVTQALKTALVTARVFENLGFATTPPANERRADIIQAIRFGKPELLVAFCQGIQTASPVDSMALPEPWDMPGYDDPVVMAAGTFVAGASIELSADGPMREPYTAYMQGGLTYTHGRIALAEALNRMLKTGALKLPET
jgi:cystathionine beta-lyase family protein involved in aluminum resistance